MLRKSKGLTRFKLGEAVGIDANTIARYEQGKIKPSIGSAMKLADFFNVSVDEFLNGPSQKEIEIKVTIHQTDDWEEEKLDMTQTGYEISHAHMSPHKVSVTLTLDTEKEWDHEGALSTVLAETERRALIALKAQRDMETPKG
jgi:transcriptional regulator with XRE-family HTH domain